MAQVAVQVLFLAAFGWICGWASLLELGNGQVAAVAFALLVNSHLLLAGGCDLAGHAVQTLLLPAPEGGPLISKASFFNAQQTPCPACLTSGTQ